MINFDQKKKNTFNKCTDHWRNLIQTYLYVRFVQQPRPMS